MSSTFIYDFTAGECKGARSQPGGGLEGTGTWTSPVFRVAPFSRAIASWNAMGGEVEIEIRVALHLGWSPWFTFGPWSLEGRRHSVADQSVHEVGRLAADTLSLTRPSEAWQVRANLKGARLKRLWLVAYDPAHHRPDAPYRAAWGVDLPVPLRSQMIYPNGGNVWCSPTSLVMAMAFYGHVESIPDQVVPGVFDPVYDGHGNWPFNTAYAGARGFSAHVDRFVSFAELEQEIAAGRPVICSVAYDRAWMPEALYPKTGGHLLVVRGFSAEGDVIVNDPAAPADEGVRAVYRRANFKRAWLDRGGIVYLIRPEGQ
jgi:hypothetical protein